MRNRSYRPESRGLFGCSELDLGSESLAMPPARSVQSWSIKVDVDLFEDGRVLSIHRDRSVPWNSDSKKCATVATA